MHPKENTCIFKQLVSEISPDHGTNANSVSSEIKNQKATGCFLNSFSTDG